MVCSLTHRNSVMGIFIVVSIGDQRVIRPWTEHNLQKMPFKTSCPGRVLDWDKTLHHQISTWTKMSSKPSLPHRYQSFPRAVVGEVPGNKMREDI